MRLRVSPVLLMGASSIMDTISTPTRIRWDLQRHKGGKQSWKLRKDLILGHREGLDSKRELMSLTSCLAKKAIVDSEIVGLLWKRTYTGTF